LHLHTAEACFNNTSKPFLNGPESEWETNKIIAMAAAAVGGEEKLKTRKPIAFGSAVSSPLKLTRKGTPVVYSSYGTALDLRLGTSPLGSPETALIGASVAGLCRYYQLPNLVPGISSDSKQHGIQAAFEKTMTGVSAALAGASLLVGIGGLETGLTFDFGQAVLDDEIFRLIGHFKQGIEVKAETLSTDLIDEIGHWGNHLSHRETLLRMKSLSQTRLFDRHNREDWEFNGKPDSYAKARARAVEILASHQPEPLPEGVAERLREIVIEAEKEVGVKQKYESTSMAAI
jgi:trimethylamine--corrinoid protein Co-methyltransferase